MKNREKMKTFPDDFLEPADQNTKAAFHTKAAFVLIKSVEQRGKKGSRSQAGRDRGVKGLLIFVNKFTCFLVSLYG